MKFWCFSPGPSSICKQLEETEQCKDCVIRAFWINNDLKPNICKVCICTICSKGCFNCKTEISDCVFGLDNTLICIKEN